MSDQNQPSDLDSLLAQLANVEEPFQVAGSTQTPARFIVATDWSTAAVPLTALRAFRAIFTSDAPVQLAFAVPHEPGPDDAACIHVLLDGLALDGARGEDLSGLEVISFDKACANPYDSAVVPTGDEQELITQVGGLILRMHDLARRMDRAVGDTTTNRGETSALRVRLSAFSV